MRAATSCADSLQGDSMRKTLQLLTVTLVLGLD